MEPTSIGGRGNDVPKNVLLTLMEYEGYGRLTRKECGAGINKMYWHAATCHVKTGIVLL
jgi:hypothetical protein